MKTPSYWIWVVIAALVGGLAGGAAGFFASGLRGPASGNAATTSTGSATTTNVLPSISLVPLERQSSVPLLPPEFVNRGSSSVASLYQQPSGATFEDKLLGPSQLLGQAVALTSDGWFVTLQSNVGSVHVADLVLMHGGQAYPVTRAVADSIDGTVFLKTAVSDASPVAFVHVEDLAAGAQVWSETRPNEFAPHVVTDIRGRRQPNEDASSEVATRRILTDGVAANGDAGGALWDPNGALVGLIESAPGEGMRIVPSTAIAASFQRLLSTGSIIHAALGVHAYDLGTTLLADASSTLPNEGALLRDQLHGKPAVTPSSPAAKAKLRAGDVIESVDRDILDGSADLGEILSEYPVGANVTVRVRRGTEDLNIPVTLGAATTSIPLK